MKDHGQTGTGARRPRPGVFIFMWLIAAAVLLPSPARAAAPRRVISLSPNLTEAVFAIGAEDLLVGVSDFCQYPSAARAIRRCGSWSYPNFEVVSALKPDLILVLGRSEKVRDFGRRRAIAVEGFTMDSVATIQRELLRMGKLLGRGDSATSLTRAIAAQLAQLKDDLARRPLASQPSVLLSLGRQPGAMSNLMTPNGGSFLDEALTLAGGRNVCGDLKGFYLPINKESLLVRRPEVIIELTGGVELNERQRRQMIDDWKGLPTLPAVQSGRIYILTPAYLMTPGPRLPQIVRALREVLYPVPTR